MGGCCAFQDGKCTFQAGSRAKCEDKVWTDIATPTEMRAWKQFHINAANRTGVMLFLLTYFRGAKEYDPANALMPIETQKKSDPNYMRTRKMAINQDWTKKMG